MNSRTFYYSFFNYVSFILLGTALLVNDLGSGLLTQKQKVAQWRSSGILNPNGISTTDIKQWLSLGREPSSSLHIINFDGKQDDSFFNTSGWCGKTFQ